MSEESGTLWHPGANPTGDAVVIGHDEDMVGRILLVTRARPPFQGFKAFPGGFVDTDAKRGEPFDRSRETALSAAIRETMEECGVDLSKCKSSFVGTYDSIGRDPRNSETARVEANTYLFLMESPLPEPKGGDDADKAEWIPIADVVSGKAPLAFDHSEIFEKALSVLARIAPSPSIRNRFEAKP